MTEIGTESIIREIISRCVVCVLRVELGIIVMSNIEGHFLWLITTV